MMEVLNEEQKLTYDDRRKVLTQDKSMKGESKTEDIVVDGKVTEKGKLISIISQTMKQEFTEEGIKLAYKNLSSQKTFLEQKKANLKNEVEDLGEEPEEVTKFRENLKALQKFDAAEKKKEDLKATQIELKKVSQEINELKEVVGGRIKL